MLYMAAKTGTHAGIKAKAETNLSLTFKAFPTRKMINEPAKAKTPSRNGLERGFNSKIRGCINPT